MNHTSGALQYYILHTIYVRITTSHHKKNPIGQFCLTQKNREEYHILFTLSSPLQIFGSPYWEGKLSQPLPPPYTLYYLKNKTEIVLQAYKVQTVSTPHEKFLYKSHLLVIKN